VEGEIPRNSAKKAPDWLIDLENASRFDDRGFLLAVGKALGTFAINIDTGELLAVVVVHGDLPVAVFATLIVAEPAGFLCLLLFHYEKVLEAIDYGKFHWAAQVSS
jgi:hypothetical protein